MVDSVWQNKFYAIQSISLTKNILLCCPKIKYSVVVGKQENNCGRYED